MTPKEKAQELIDKFENVDDCDEHHYERFSPCYHQSIQCAIVCVEQIIKAIHDRLDSSIEELNTKYWQDVLDNLKNS